MPQFDNTPSSHPLGGAAAFEMFVWLQEPYADVAAATDFQSLSSFERWERLREYVVKVSYLLGKNKVTAFDDVANESKAKLLQWLEEGYQRTRPGLSTKAASTDRPLFSHK